MSTESFRFGPLIAVVKHLGSSDLYRVSLTGQDGTYQAPIHAENHASAAYSMIEELEFAARHPHQFMHRRRMELNDFQMTDREERGALAQAEEAVQYAAKRKDALRDALRSVEEHRARRLGSFS